MQKQFGNILKLQNDDLTSYPTNKGKSFLSIEG